MCATDPAVAAPPVEVAADTDGRGSALPRVVSIVGPTASGKTGLGIAIARALAERGERAEIVNADAYQMYRGIRGIRPILVGGSGLYARAAIDDISFPGTDPDVRARLEHRAEAEGPGILFEELKAKDPEAAARMDPRNPRRTIRALEVIELTGRPYSASLPRYRYVIPSVQIGLDLPREELDRCIDLRTEQMRADGFVDEVRRLRPHLGATASRALGYQQVIDALDGLWSEDEAFADIAQKTKRLARKQMGWFGRDPRIHWLRAQNPDLVSNAMAVIAHADAGDYDAIDAQADAYTQHHLGDIAG